jgi:hypothetical protein
MTFDAGAKKWSRELKDRLPQIRAKLEQGGREKYKKELDVTF